MERRSIPVLLVLVFGHAHPLSSETLQPAEPSREEWMDLHLRIAVHLWSTGNLHDAARELEAIVFGESSFREGERAAFLLAEAYARLGNDRGLRGLARISRTEAGDSVYQDWIRYLDLLNRTGDALPEPQPPPESDLPTAELLTAHLLIQGGHPDEALALLRRRESGRSSQALLFYMETLALEAAGLDSKEVLEKLAHIEGSTAAEKDLVTLARIRLATEELNEGRSPIGLLTGVPPESRYASRAELMLALCAVEQGDRESGRARLERLLDESEGYEEHHDVALSLAALAMEEERWRDSYRILSKLEEGWQEEHLSLRGLQEEGNADSLWERWENRLLLHDALILDPGPVLEAVEEMVGEAIDLRSQPRSRMPRGDLFDLPEPLDGVLPSILLLETEEMSEARELGRERERTAFLLREARHRVVREEDDLARRQGYLKRGLSRCDSTLDKIRLASARLDSLHSSLSAILADLQAIRDRAIDRLASQTEKILERIETNRTIARSLYHLYVGGPNRQRAEPHPSGVPSPEEILRMEEILLGDLEGWVRLFGARAPVLVERSHRDVWVPRLTAGVGGMSREASHQIARAEGLRTIIDSSLAHAKRSESLLAQQRRAESLERRFQELTSLRAKLGRKIVADLLERAMTLHEARGEGVGYAFAITTDELARDSATNSERTLHDDQAPRWRQEAIDRFHFFLGKHTQSAARGEIRFRLADLLLGRARDELNREMADYLEAEDGEKGTIPILEYQPALDLYLAMLEEDRDFHHLDAVLYNVGMIRLDEGNSEGVAILQELAQDYPHSPFRQEAFLRLGDERFHARDFTASIPHFEEAAGGEDPELSAIALYKMGWAHFNQDRYVEAAISFQRLLDHYEAATDTIAADLQSEAREYLIHSLARAGGADAFGRLFDSTRQRPYEPEILAGLAALLRRFSLYAEASAADRLWLERFPAHPKAPAAGRRLVDTYERWNRPQMARDARLDLAQRFVKGSPWFEANRSDSLRREGEEFAFEACRAAALYDHHEARKSGSAKQWREALRIYERMTRLWPNRPETAMLHYHAGEVAAGLHDFRAAVTHFSEAARADMASWRVDASWQVVATLDAWYETTREAEGPGDDSLAQALMEAADRFAHNHSADPRLTDLLWRKANLAYAHQWHDRAEDAFLRFLNLCGDDERAALAARLRGQVLFDEGDYSGAAEAYDLGTDVARRLDADSLVMEMERLVPLCLFKNAEESAHSQSPEEAARLFEDLAVLWQEYEHADLAFYRAGLGYGESGRHEEAVRCWTQLTRRHPGSEWARDARLQIATTWERLDRPAAAARALERFSDSHPDDEDAPAALLKAAELLSEAGDGGGSEALKTRYLKRFPDDVETAAAVLSERATRELDAIGPDRPISTILGPGSEKSSLALYRDLAAAHPEVESPAIRARAQFLIGEEAYDAYTRARLAQPIARSIEAKKALLEEVLVEYRKCAELGGIPWNRAAAFRIGESLVHFGDALLASQPPAELSGDDLAAYEEVLGAKAWELFDRGEQTWTTLLEGTVSADDDEGEWIAKTKGSLWPRIALRFVHRAEVEYPLLKAEAPKEPVR